MLGKQNLVRNTLKSLQMTHYSFKTRELKCRESISFCAYFSHLTSLASRLEAKIMNILYGTNDAVLISLVPLGNVLVSGV